VVHRSELGRGVEDHLVGEARRRLRTSLGCRRRRCMRGSRLPKRLVAEARLVQGAARGAVHRSAASDRTLAQVAKHLSARTDLAPVRSRTCSTTFRLSSRRRSSSRKWGVAGGFTKGRAYRFPFARPPRAMIAPHECPPGRPQTRHRRPVARPGGMFAGGVHAGRVGNLAGNADLGLRARRCQGSRDRRHGNTGPRSRRLPRSPPTPATVSNPTERSRGDMEFKRSPWRAPRPPCGPDSPAVTYVFAGATFAQSRSPVP
jgi:hypothetical protein